jgi:hypothetical protein
MHILSSHLWGGVKCSEIIDVCVDGTDFGVRDSLSMR